MITRVALFALLFALVLGPPALAAEQLVVMEVKGMSCDL